MAWHPSITDRNLTGDFMTIPTYVNDVTNQWASILILLGAYIIIAMGVYAASKDIFEGFAIAGFVTVLVATLFWWAGFISGTILVFTVVVAMLSFAGLWLGKKSD